MSVSAVVGVNDSVAKGRKVVPSQRAMAPPGPNAYTRLPRRRSVPDGGDTPGRHWPVVPTSTGLVDVTPTSSSSPLGIRVAEPMDGPPVGIGSVGRRPIRSDGTTLQRP